MPALPLFALAIAFADDPAQTVRVEVATDWRPQNLRVYAETTWLGEDRKLELKNDGTVAGDVAMDNIFVGVWTGEPVRELAIRIVAEAQDVPRAEAGAGIEPVALGEDRVVYAMSLNDKGKPVARRVAAALPGPAQEMVEPTMIAATLGWVALAFAYVGWLVHRTHPSTS
ncbi:MAG: hypothetical protein ACOZNI_26010 [Myxococcota bacterium]